MSYIPPIFFLILTDGEITGADLFVSSGILSSANGAPDDEPMDGFNPPTATEVEVKSTTEKELRSILDGADAVTGTSDALLVVKDDGVNMTEPGCL